MCNTHKKYTGKDNFFFWKIKGLFLVGWCGKQSVSSPRKSKNKLCVFCDCSVVWQEEEREKRWKSGCVWLCSSLSDVLFLYKVNITLAQGDGMIIFLTGCFFAETTCSHVFKHYTCVQVCRGDRWKTQKREQILKLMKRFWV